MRTSSARSNVHGGIGYWRLCAKRGWFMEWNDHQIHSAASQITSVTSPCSSHPSSSAINLIYFRENSFTALRTHLDCGINYTGRYQVRSKWLVACADAASHVNDDCKGPITDDCNVPHALRGGGFAIILDEFIIIIHVRAKLLFLELLHAYVCRSDAQLYQRLECWVIMHICWHRLIAT